MSTASIPLTAPVTHIRLDELRRSGESPLWREMRWDEYRGLVVPAPCWAAIDACSRGLEIGRGYELLLRSPVILRMDEETRWGLYTSLHRSWLWVRRGEDGTETIGPTWAGQKLVGYRSKILRFRDEPGPEDGTGGAEDEPTDAA